MANDNLKDLHLFIMQSFLPVGLGVVKNARSGGLKKVVDVLNSQDPLSEFQLDGANDAKTVREQIDQLIPGLGNPVVSVDVTVEENYAAYDEDDPDSLVLTLNRIDNQLTELHKFIDNDLNNVDD